MVTIVQQHLLDRGVKITEDGSEFLPSDFGIWADLLIKCGVSGMSTSCVNNPLIVLFVASTFGPVDPVLADEPKIVTNSIGMKLIEIPAGEFMMGAEEDRAATMKTFTYHFFFTDLLESESPRHKVRITKSFLMGRCEVTLGEFLKFYRDAEYTMEIERNRKLYWGYDDKREFVHSGEFRPWSPLAWKPDMDHPAVFVSWNDAVAFCQWLSKKEGKTYRLPTEAEWEYCCRAGTTDRYHFGNDPEELPLFANTVDADRKTLFPDSNLGSVGKDTDPIPYPFLSKRDGYGWAAPVGKFRPNAFGLYDMHGNASEWCSDWFDKKYYSNSPVDDPQGPPKGKKRVRVRRGGGFSELPVFLRCAARDYSEPSDPDGSSGFRVVCEAID